MSTSVEKIKERLNIVDLLGAYLKLEKAGKNFKARCPFHNEKSPSFFVSPDRDSYYCFGCGAKGDIFTFVEQFEGLDFFGALKMLAEKTGVTLDRGTFDKQDNKEAIFNCLEATTQFFESNLSKSNSAQKYLEKRGITEKTIKDWRIGFVSNDWRNLYEYLTARKFTDEQIKLAGLIKKKEGGSGFYDRFRGRIMFPISDSASRVVGFTGRILPENQTRSMGSGQVTEVAKYLNSPETAVFNKSRILYGFDSAKLSIRRMGYSVIVEGQLDIIMCHQAGFTNVVATSGTALTPEHLGLLKRISNKVIMAFDADKAGMNAATKAWQLALSLGMEVKIVEFKDDKDPADILISENGKEKFKQALKDSMHIIDFYLNKIFADKLDERKTGFAIKDTVLPFLVFIESSIEKSHWVKKISEKFNISEKAIYEDLDRIKVEPSANGAIAKTIEDKQPIMINRVDSIERKIFGILYSREKDPEIDINITDLKNKIQEIVGEANFKKWMEISGQLINELIFEIEQYYDKNKIKVVLDELLTELEKEYTMKKLGQAKTPEEQNLLIKKLARLK
jgi:DNA primase